MRKEHNYLERCIAFSIENEREEEISMLNRVRNLVIAEEGQGMTEYGLVLGVIAIAVVGILVTMRGEIEKMFTNAKDKLIEANKPATTTSGL